MQPLHSPRSLRNSGSLKAWGPSVKHWLLYGWDPESLTLQVPNSPVHCTSEKNMLIYIYDYIYIYLSIYIYYVLAILICPFYLALSSY